MEFKDNSLWDGYNKLADIEPVYSYSSPHFGEVRVNVFKMAVPNGWTNPFVDITFHKNLTAAKEMLFEAFNMQEEI